jgi:hypothetical protein
MNALSWLIYLAGVFEKLAPTVSSLASWFATLAVLTTIASLIVYVVTILNAPTAIFPRALAEWYGNNARYPSLYPDKSKPKKEDYILPEGHWTDHIIAQKKWFIRIPTMFSTSALIVALIYPLIPAKETVYAIAASEIAEEVVTDPRVLQTTNKAFAAVDAWLDKQLEDKNAKAQPQPAQGRNPAPPAPEN